MTPPDRVTRFYGCVDFALDVLKNLRIAFIHVTMLNDPFDPYCFFETDFGGTYEGLLRHVKENHPHDMPWFRAHVCARSWGNAVKELKACLVSLRATSFMLSTSAGRDGNHPHANLYMWGHYAQGHRGLALEFDTRALARAALQVHEAENGKPSDDQNVWAKVEYSERFEPISAEHVFEFMKQEMKLDRRKKAAREVTQIDRYYNRMSIIKSDVWQNENEWRLMWRSTEDRKVYYCPIGKDAVTGVLLGMGLPDEKASDITRAVRSNFPDTPIFRARKRHGDFALEFHQI